MGKGKILIVEDEKIVALDIQQRLQNLGFEIAGLASSGSEAIKRAESHRPDLVLMDIMLRGSMDGIESARKIKSDFGIPVVFVSAYIDDDTVNRAKVSEPYGYILKPFEERELHSTIVIALYKHEMEEQERRSEQWLAAALHGLVDAVIATDSNRLVKFLNPQAERLTGWTNREAIGKPLESVLKATSTAGHDSLDTATILATPRDSSVPGELVLVRRDGEKFLIEFNASKIFDRHQNLLGSVVVLRDITERRRAEHERAVLEEQLRQAQKMEAVGQLAGGIAHDFNNLLTGIIGNATLVKKKISGDSLAYINQIENACLRATEFIRKLLTFSRKSHLETRPVDLGEMIGDVLSLCVATFDPRITVSVDSANTLPRVSADATQLHQLLLNLCMNARDALQQKLEGPLDEELNLLVGARGITLAESEIDRIADAKPGLYVRVVVADNGVGMSAETQQKIFEPFFTTKGPGKGTGLGLSVAYGIVRQLGGWINLTSKLGTGTTFEIFLPATKVAETETQPAPPDPTTPTGFETILLVEDQDIVREVTQGMLEDLGYRVLVAESGYVALDLFVKNRPTINLVMTDLSMPGMPGEELLKRLRQIDPKVKVICASGHATDDFLLQNDLPSCSFLPKPYDMPRLAQAIRGVLDEGR